MVYSPVVFRYTGGVLILKGEDATQGLQVGMFGGQEDGIGDSGQWARNSASR